MKLNIEQVKKFCSKKTYIPNENKNSSHEYFYEKKAKVTIPLDIKEKRHLK